MSKRAISKPHNIGKSFATLAIIIETCIATQILYAKSIKIRVLDTQVFSSPSCCGVS